MNPADIAKEAAALALGAVGAAIGAALAGAPLDASLAAAAEHISDARAKARFPGLVIDKEG